MLAASGCHKDSFDFDEFTRPTATTPDDGTELPSSTRTPNIAIFSPPTAQEGEQVVLMITSDADAPAGGLVVMFEISGATDGEFTTTPASACTNLVCTVRILEGNRRVDLVLMPTSDSAAETERWTASLVDGGDDYNFADRNNNAAFDIVDSIAVVGIATSDSVMEGNAVVLTITSSIAAPTNGLTVTINIGVADVDEFTANAEADCTTAFPRCIVTIPAGSRAVSLTLSPLSDFSTEPGERWTATLVDDDDNDYNLDAGNNNVGFDIDDLIAVVDIMTSDTTAIENGAVTLTITSDLPAPAGGLSVTINIGGADATDFTNADCTNLVCIVTILENERSVILTLSPLSDFSTEPGERWTATLVDTGAYNPAAGGDDNVAFDITDLIAVVDIMTSDTTAIENGAVTLTISSTLPAPAGGLSVTINIGGADATDFTNADCTNLVCIVTILENERSVILTLTPLSDFSTEPGERWTATLVDTGAYNPAAGGDDNVGFDITDLIAALGIATSDAAIEGGAVTLTITSDIPAPASGLAVTINIGGADNADFTSAACTTPPQCVVVIASGMRTATLTIMASSDADTIAEEWTAAIAIPANGDFAADPANADADFIISETALPAVANNLLLSALNAYTIPAVLATNEIRAGGDENGSRAAIPITGFRYGDAAAPDVFVQKLDFAHIGIWINGNLADNDFDYAWLGENVVASPADTDNRGDAIYDVEGDATYKGVNFFPDGTMTMHFDSGTFDVLMSAFASEIDDDFGGTLVPTGVGGFFLRFTGGTITADGFAFSGTPQLGNHNGFFSDLNIITSFSMSGRFHDDSATYAPDMAAPTELSGVAEIIDGGGTDDLHMGFLGRRR